MKIIWVHKIPQTALDQSNIRQIAKNSKFIKPQMEITHAVKPQATS